MTNPPNLPLPYSKERMIEQMIRVNHAGEFGAKRIYEGQMFVLKNTPFHKEIEHMYQQELVHLNYFEQEISRRQIRPTVLYPLWNVFAFALGAVSAVGGIKSAMKCTVAIEEVIGEHYATQVDDLSVYPEELVLRTKIQQFRDDELEHKESGLQYNSNSSFSPMSVAVQTISKIAIWLSKRI